MCHLDRVQVKCSSIIFISIIRTYGEDFASIPSFERISPWKDVTSDISLPSLNQVNRQQTASELQDCFCLNATTTISEIIF